MDPMLLHQRLTALEKSFVFHKSNSQRRVSDETELDREVANRVDVLEYNLSRVLLILQTLIVACRQKNVFTEAEFDALQQEMDIADGQADGTMAFESVAGFQKKPEQTSFFSFLRNMDSSPDSSDTPGEFLSKLNGMDQPE
jgi:hypothetical protein